MTASGGTSPSAVRARPLSLWADGHVRQTETDPNHAGSFFDPNWLVTAIGQVFQNADSDWPFDMADLWAYGRALSDQEIQTRSEH